MISKTPRIRNQNGELFEDDQVTKLHTDWTVNLPTLIVLVSTLVGGVGASVALYNGIRDDVKTVTTIAYQNQKDIAQNKQDRDSAVQNLQIETRELRKTQLEGLDRIRTELRAELRDVNGKLDTLILRGQK